MMFDFIADGLTIITAILFPIYASYKALSTSDPALLHPWLIYWVCFAILSTSTSILYPFLSYMPFYSWIRFGIHLYLLLPGEQQGAAYIYRLHIEPWLKNHDRDIEQLISTSHDKIKTAGMEYLKKLVNLVKAQLLGIPDDSRRSTSTSTSSQSQLPRSSQQEQQTQNQTYAQSLLARFSLPSARSATVLSATSAAAEDALGIGPAAGGTNAALYGLLSSALQAAAGSASRSPSSSRSPYGSGTGGSTATTSPAVTTSGANTALFGLLSSAVQAAAASASKSPSGSRSTSGSGPEASTTAAEAPADSAKYAHGLKALLNAFDGQTGASADSAKDIRAPSPTPSPPAGFEAIEHEDARMEGSVMTTPEKPNVLKRRSTSGGWGGWMWGSKKEGKVEERGKEKAVLEEMVDNQVEEASKE